MRWEEKKMTLFERDSSTAEFAARLGVKAATLRRAVCVNGHYFGARPEKRHNGRLNWPPSETNKVLRARDTEKVGKKRRAFVEVDEETLKYEIFPDQHYNGIEAEKTRQVFERVMRHQTDIVIAGEEAAS